MTKTTPVEFAKQVRQETSRVAWPSRRETIITTVMVLILSIVAAIFFFAADRLIAVGIRKFLGIGW